MKTAARKVLLLSAAVVLMMLLPAAGRGADSAPAPPSVTASSLRDLLAHGTDEWYWSADVMPTNERRGGVMVSGVKTTVRVRSAGQPQWREIAALAAPARDVANRGNELLVALEDGGWMIVTDDGARSGVPLPAGARIRALCGDEDDIWAVGEAEKGKLLQIPPPPPPPRQSRTSAPSTGSATTAASIATAPAAPTAALPPHEVGLFLLRRGQWAERDVLPGSVRSGDILAVSLAMIDRRLMLALATRDLAVRVYSRDEEGKWDAGTDVAVLVGERGKIKLMNLEGRPALWVADGAAPATDPGALFLRSQRWSEAKKLEPSLRLAGFDRRTLTVALGRIRLLASDGRGRLKEQLYNTDGTLSGEPIDAVTIARRSDDWLAQGLQLLVVLVLVVWMISSMRQRPAVRDAMARADDLHLAPLGRRLAGGLIDMVPLVLGFVLAEHAMRAGAQTGTQPPLTYQSPAFAWLAAGAGMYILLTTAVELFTRGRSLGKLVVGTRVASLDSSRPVPAALLIRNLLRLVDLLLFFPLSFVIFSPLRQHVGDMAAGTIVVMNDAPELPPKPPESKSPESKSEDE